MRWLLDALYLLVLLILSPWLLYKAITTGKYRRGLWSKLTGNAPSLSLSPCLLVSMSPRPRVWFHGVSVGEIHLLRSLVAQFRQHYPQWECVISTTTDTGYEEARKRFPDLTVFYWPLDFSWAVSRALTRVRPDLVVLAEGEIWPNFLLATSARGIPVAVVNARLSPRSAGRYRRLNCLVGPLLKRIDRIAAQTEEYAACFRELGVDPERVRITGSVKYDRVEADRANSLTANLRQLLNVRDDELVWIAGSTQHPEEEICLRIYQEARKQHPNLRLILVPRQRERFDEVAAQLRRQGQPFVRRSALAGPLGDPAAVVLVDTIGELGALWGLADVAFVGGSLDGRRGGQNMIEPAAYGAAVVFGPHVWNFRDTATRLVHAGAAIQITDEGSLATTIQLLLRDAAARERLGNAARHLVQQQQGATARTIALLGELIAEKLCGRSAA